MNWDKYEKASDLKDLEFQDGVIGDKPCWFTKRNINCAYIYHCEEGGFGALIIDEHDNEDGAWGQTLEEAQKQVQMIFDLIDQDV